MSMFFFGVGTAFLIVATSPRSVNYPYTEFIMAGVCGLIALAVEGMSRWGNK